MSLYLFYLSGDCLELAKEEIFGLLGELKEEEEDTQLVLARGEVPLEKLARLALTHEVCEFLGSCTLEKLETLFKEKIIPHKEPVCIRVKKIGKRSVNSSFLERKLGEIIWKKGVKISVSSPAEVIKVYVSNKCFVGRLIFKVNKKQFFERRPDRKPFFRPSVILPKFARALVNITGIKEKEILLDPMCGVGTILVEAGLMDVNIVGVELFEKIIKGCTINLKHYGLPNNLIRGDVRNLPFKDKSIDAIVTDFPYLKSSRSIVKLDELYELSISEFKRVLKKGKKAVIVSDRDVDNIIKKFLKIEKKVYQRIHKNLIRRIFICRNYN